MAAVTFCSDFGAQEKKICHYLHFFPFYLYKHKFKDKIIKNFKMVMAEH